MRSFPYLDKNFFFLNPSRLRPVSLLLGVLKTGNICHHLKLLLGVFDLNYSTQNLLLLSLKNQNEAMKGEKAQRMKRRNLYQFFILFFNRLFSQMLEEAFCTFNFFFSTLAKELWVL